jgi:hypothetical protein
MLSVFAVGTLQFVDTVEAATWKKYDSGTFADEYPAAGDKNIMSYQSYVKGNNELYVNLYSFSKKTGNKKLDTKITFVKKNGVMKITMNYYSWNEKFTNQGKTPYSVKTVYKSTMKEIKKSSSVPPEKIAFDKQSFTVNNNNFKVYGINYSKNVMEVYIYKNNEEYCHFSVYKENNKIIYEEHNQNRKLVSKESFKSPNTLTSIYKNKLNKIVNKIKSSPATVSGGKTYNDGYVSFKYPSSWTRYSSTGADKLVSFKTSKGDTSIFSVFMSNAGKTSIKSYRSFYEPSGSEKLISSKYITINGAKGFDVSLNYYTNGGGQQKIVGFVKKGTFYRMIFTTGSLNAISSDMNMIINSFKAL